MSSSGGNRGGIIGTPVVANLGGNQAIAAAATTIITTGALAVGLWMVNVVVTIENTAVSITICDVWLAAGTCVCTFPGGVGTSESFPLTAGYGSVPLTLPVKVTTAGTLLIRGQGSQAGCTALTTTPEAAITPATSAYCYQIG